MGFNVFLFSHNLLSNCGANEVRIFLFHVSKIMHNLCRNVVDVNLTAFVQLLHKSWHERRHGTHMYNRNPVYMQQIIQMRGCLQVFQLWFEWRLRVWLGYLMAHWYGGLNYRMAWGLKSIINIRKHLNELIFNNFLPNFYFDCRT